MIRRESDNTTRCASARRLKSFLTRLVTFWAVASVPLLAAELTGLLEFEALAEVWVDVNGDGRFDPNPAQGERISMTRGDGAPGTSPVFRASSHIPERHAVAYVFRFADAQ